MKRNSLDENPTKQHADNNTIQNDDSKIWQGPKDNNKPESETENLVGDGTLIGNIGALITKRFHLYKRDIIGLICEIIVPVILVIIGLIITLGMDYIKISDPRILDPSNYPGP